MAFSDLLLVLGGVALLLGLWPAGLALGALAWFVSGRGL
jgi:hypothetical protein